MELVANITRPEERRNTTSVSSQACATIIRHFCCQIPAPAVQQYPHLLTGWRVTHVSGFLLREESKPLFPLPDAELPTNASVFLVAQVDASHRSGSYKKQR